MIYLELQLQTLLQHWMLYLRQPENLNLLLNSQSLQRQLLRYIYSTVHCTQIFMYFADRSFRDSYSGTYTVLYTLHRYLCTSQIEPLEIVTQVHNRKLYTVHRYFCISHIEPLQIQLLRYIIVYRYTVNICLCTSQIELYIQ